MVYKSIELVHAIFIQSLSQEMRSSIKSPRPLNNPLDFHTFRCPTISSKVLTDLHAFPISFR